MNDMILLIYLYINHDQQIDHCSYFNYHSFPWSPLKRDETIRGFHPSLRELFIKSSSAHCVLEPIVKLGESFGPSSFHHTTFERIIGSNMEVCAWDPLS